MRNRIVIAFIFSLSFILVNAQANTSAGSIVFGKIYSVKIKNSKAEKFGYLVGFTDSAVLISRKKIEFSNQAALEIPLQSIPYHKIGHIGFREKGRVFKGIWIGSLIGIVTGTIVGTLAYQKPEPSPGWDIDFGAGLSGVAGGSIGFFSGIIIGGALRSGRIKYNIDGNLDNFRKMKNLIFE